MRAKKTILAFGLAALIGGCQRPQISTAPAAQPATQPVVASTGPQTKPAQQAPLVSLMVGNRQYWFPPALLRLSDVDGKIDARLTTDDPKEALEPNYVGNSFDLEMPNIADDQAWQETGQGVWTCVSQGSLAQSDSDDSPHGIFLQGQARRLYPKTATVEFSGHGSHVTVEVRGQFLLYENEARADQSFALPQLVSVVGKMEATVPAK
ncbi:MAG TPA: hypothetical protein VMD30_04855 [Tepidisphaeraceae bacterium]|nr:hypothetical protein [Tepidisphaeraceae bacterium]